MRRTDDCARQLDSSGYPSAWLCLEDRVARLEGAGCVDACRACLLHQGDAEVRVRRDVLAGQIGASEHVAVLRRAHGAIARACLDEPLAEALRERGIGRDGALVARAGPIGGSQGLSLIHISEPTRLLSI